MVQGAAARRLAALLALLGPWPCGAGPGEEGTCDAASGACGEASNLRWEPKTVSVVLPCAGEGEFARKTVESIWNSVPGGAAGGVLADIVVVDDGSNPPLEKLLPEDFRERHGVKLVRHKRSRGLIQAKAAGAALATGDLLVFFDCHVAPQAGWHAEFLKASAENYRRIVVPQITDLDIDTWTERSRSNAVSKCYLTWDADFKWLQSSSPYIPILSGGLLGISRRWWDETGGYDESMKDWGGENIDQSLRTWLCGGEIVSVPKAAVAHMWRSPEDKRTTANYRILPINAMVNRVRAALGWYGNFTAKLQSYPDFKMVMQRMSDQMDVSAFRKVQGRLECRPFAWFLWRFRDVYEGGGLLPKETFQLQHAKSKKCLTYDGPAGTHPRGFGGIVLHPCDTPYRSRMWPLPNPHAQRWHEANQKAERPGECCSGFRAWNSDQCLAITRDLGTTVCDVRGRGDMAWKLTDGSDGLAPGQLAFRGKCLAKVKDGLVLAECRPKKQGKEQGPVWQMISPAKPLETELYEAALLERPELFSERAVTGTEV